MDEIALAYEKLLGRVVKWAQTEDNIRAVLVVGSRARSDHPADEWSDLDVVIIANDPEPYLAKTDWLKNIGKPWLTFIEPAPIGGGAERRVLFEGGLDVDFAPASVADMQQTRDKGDAPEFTDLARRGIRVMVDKDKLFEGFKESEIEPLKHSPPAEAEFLNVVNDFWYHSYWTAQKIRRGELWWAKSCCDGYMKSLLLRMMEWHTQATKGETVDTWMSGRFLEEWVDPRALSELGNAFGRYNKGDIKRALLATMGLFRWLARETAQRWGFNYPAFGDKAATGLVEKVLAGIT